MGKLYGAIDLHSNNSFCGISDEQDKVLAKRRFDNNIKEIAQFFKPHKKNLAGIVVESTYNGYWLLDALEERGYKVQLANPAQMKQYEGLKYTDDESDTFWMNRMNRLGILPEGYIYPKTERPIRDLLRRRRMLVNTRIRFTNSLQHQFSTWKARKIPLNEIRKLSEEVLYKIFKDTYLVKAGDVFVTLIKCLDEQIKLIEEKIWGKAKKDRIIKRLMSLPGIGKILSLTIKYETGDIDRFESQKNYVSYCRCVNSLKISNLKIKGRGNGKNGNKFLRWAFGEAVIYALKFPEIKKYHDRLVRKKGTIKAKAIIASKLARSAYRLMKEKDFVFEQNKLFI